MCFSVIVRLGTDALSQTGMSNKVAVRVFYGDVPVPFGIVCEV